MSPNLSLSPEGPKLGLRLNLGLWKPDEPTPPGVAVGTEHILRQIEEGAEKFLRWANAAQPSATIVMDDCTSPQHPGSQIAGGAFFRPSIKLWFSWWADRPLRLDPLKFILTSPSKFKSVECYTLVSPGPFRISLGTGFELLKPFPGFEVVRAAK